MSPYFYRSLVIAAVMHNRKALAKSTKVEENVAKVIKRVEKAKKAEKRKKELLYE